MTSGTRDAVRRMLEAHATATLATVGADGPWAATVFFASDPALNLYFVSDHRTRHGRDIAARPRVAVAINADCRAWAEIRGLQVTGRVEMLEAAGRAAGLERYLAKFRDLKALLEAPNGAAEEAIAKRFGTADLYRVRPDWIRLIDNSRGFGYKEEIAPFGDTG